MICTKPGCQGKIKITHTYVHGRGKYQRGVCLACARVYCLTTAMEEVTRRSQGARAKARGAAINGKALPAAGARPSDGGGPLV
jgi:hypothetical protein